MSLFFKINHDMPSKSILFSLAAGGPMAFQSIVLVFAAAHKSRLLGATEKMQAARQRSRAVSLLRAKIDEISQGAEVDDDTIASMLGLASFEVGINIIYFMKTQ